MSSKKSATDEKYEPFSLSFLFNSVCPLWFPVTISSVGGCIVIKTIRLGSWQNNLNKQTDLKGQHNFSYYFTLFVCGGLCHLSSCRQCSGDLIFFWEQVVYSVTEKKNVLFINIANTIILSLNFFSRTTQCPSEVICSNVSIWSAAVSLCLARNIMAIIWSQTCLSDLTVHFSMTMLVDNDHISDKQKDNNVWTSFVARYDF